MLRAAGPKRPFPRWLMVLAALQLLFLAGVGVAYLLTLADPSWWREVKPDAAASQTAEQVENGVVSQLSLARPADPKQPGYKSEPWSVSISDQDANAWLATRFKQWLENQGGHWPQELAGVQVAFEPGVIKAGVRLAGGGRVLSIQARPEVRADGSLWLTPAGTGAGAMPLPTALVLAQVRSEVIDRLPAGSTTRTEGERAIDALAGRAPALKDAMVKLDDGRHVRLMSIKLLKGRAELTFRTEKN